MELNISMADKLKPVKSMKASFSMEGGKEKDLDIHPISKRKATSIII